MATIQTSSFGLLLRRYRLAAGLTQEELAERANLSVRGIASLERGARRAPHRHTVEQLAHALNLPGEERRRFAAAARSVGSATQPAPDRPAPGGPLSSFVGRSRELAVLEQQLAGGGPRVVLLAGEPGIGKTHLLQEVLRRAAESGWTVLQGGCQRRGQDPYSPLLEALSQHLQKLTALQRQTFLQGCGWLVCLLPELSELLRTPVPLGTLSPQQERRLTFAAVARYLQNVAGLAGTLLVLDDLQWAGADALDLLVSLVTSDSADPVGVVAAYRDTDVGPDDPLTGVVADLARGSLATELPLGPLHREEAEQLLGVLLAGRQEAMQPILARAGGVPFFLVSYAQSLRARQPGDEAAPDLPWTVTRVIRQRVAALPPMAREVLGVAAIIGRVVPRGLVGEVMAQPEEEEVLSALDAACTARLLAAEGEHAYRFVHDMIREVVEADLGPGRRMVLHRRIAQALEEKAGDPPVELLAYHYTRSSCEDQAVHYLELAGDRARGQYGCAAAAVHYRDLVERLVRLGRRDESARAYEKLGETQHVSGRYDEALAALEEAADRYRLVQDLEGEVRAVAQIGQVCYRLGRLDAGIARLSEAMAGLDRLDEVQRARSLWRLWVALSPLYNYSGRYREGLEAAERAAQLARAVGDRRMLAEAEVGRGVNLLSLRSPGAALPVLEEATRLAEGASETVRTASYFAATAHLAQGAFERSRACSRRALVAAEQVGDPGWIAVASSELGFCLFHQGDWAEARVYLERGAEMASRLGPSFISSWSLAYLGQFYVGLGAWEDAAHPFDEALTMAKRLQWSALQWYVQSCLAELEVLRGCADAAVALLEPVLDEPDVDWRSAVMLPATLAWAYLARDDVTAADEMAERAASEAVRRQDLVHMVGSLRVQGMVLSRQRRRERAESTFQKALALARTMAYPYAEARILVEYGLLHGQRGEPDPARKRLEEALAVFQRLGAKKDIERTEQALAGIN